MTFRPQFPSLPTPIRRFLYEINLVKSMKCANYSVPMKTLAFPAFLTLVLTVALSPARSSGAGSLAHRYSFTTNASDSVGGADGVLRGGATISGGAVVLDGVSGYVDLPNNLVT